VALAALALAACEEGEPPTLTPAPPVGEPAPADDVDAGANDPDVRPALEITDITPGAASMRRLTRAQYVASVQAVFGDDLEVLPPTEVDLRVDGLLTVGARETTVTPAGFEGYEASARQVAADVLARIRRERVLSCTPAADDARDDACAAELVESVAPLLLRRTLSPEEQSAYVALAGAAADTLGDFHAGLGAVITAWLLSPEFLFIREGVRPGAAEGAGGVPLDAQSLAARLSYFLWARGPDRALLEAAASGVLDDDVGYRAEVERLLDDEARLEQGVRALFTDLYDLDELSHVKKDPVAFPQLTSGALEDAREQTLRTIVDHLLVRGADYRDLFTTRRTFLTRRLGPIYDVPVAEDWAVHEWRAGGARAGILSQVSFLALNARTSRSSPVLRGEFLLDKILCQTIPPPPADVNFDAVAPGDVNAPTARERLGVHRVTPSCAGCHDVLDPIGLAFENFDAIGRFRLQENGEDILTYGEIQGVPYDDVRGLHTALRDLPSLTQCLVRKLYMHGVGRLPVRGERELLAALDQSFAEADYALVPLMRTIALSHGFRATAGPAEATP
jgi:hypothetical protein